MVGRISGQYSLDALKGKKARRSTYSEGFSAGSDETSFSSFAMELARINSELKNVPDVREDKVEDLKAQVQSGSYVPPLESVARTLLMAGMLEASE